MLARAGTAPGHVFNLGHGVLPGTDPGVLAEVVAVVHDEGRAGRGVASVSAAHRGARPLARHPGDVARAIEAVLHARSDADAPDARAARGPSAPLRRDRRAPRRSPSGPPTQVVGARRARSSASAPGRFVVEGATKYADADARGRGRARSSAPAWRRSSGSSCRPLERPLSTDEYHDRACAALAERAPYRAVWSWWDAPGFAELLAARVATRSRRRDARRRSSLFTAHSLPVRVVKQGTDYPDELASAARGVAAAPASRTRASAGRARGAPATPGSAPTSLELLRSPSSRGDATTVVVCPVGFVADHLEVLYDVDVEAAAVAAATRRRACAHGVAQRRPRVLAILADVVEASSHVTHVVVVGGGHRRTVRGLRADRRRRRRPRRAPAVTVLDAADGSAASSAAVSIAGRAVDVGPDGFLARRPEAVALIGELGPPTSSSRSASRGVGPRAGPAPPPSRRGSRSASRRAVRPRREAIGMLGVRGALRAAVDLVAPRPRATLAAPGPRHRAARRRQARAAASSTCSSTRLSAGSTRAGCATCPRPRSSRRCSPPGQGRGSLMRALRSSAGARGRPRARSFVTLREGAGSLPGLLADSLDARGVALRDGRAAIAARSWRGRRSRAGWSRRTPGDAPRRRGRARARRRRATAALLAPLDADAAPRRAAIDAASVAVVTLARSPATTVALPDGGTGVLVPAGTRVR